MWDAIAQVLTNSNALIVLIFLVIFVLLFALLSKMGIVQIKTNSFRMGADARERDIIRQQIEWSQSYIMGLKGTMDLDESRYGGFLVRYVLQRCHSEVVRWISFNHINLDSDYISIKQEKIRSIILQMDSIDPKYKTKEYLKRVDKNVEDVIKKLVMIREVYK